MTPYLDEIQARIVDTFAAAGFPRRGDRHLRDRGNFSFSLIATLRENGPVPSPSSVPISAPPVWSRRSSAG